MGTRIGMDHLKNNPNNPEIVLSGANNAFLNPNFKRKDTAKLSVDK